MAYYNRYGQEMSEREIEIAASWFRDEEDEAHYDQDDVYIEDPEDDSDEDMLTDYYRSSK